MKDKAKEWLKDNGCFDTVISYRESMYKRNVSDAMADFTHSLHPVSEEEIEAASINCIEGDEQWKSILDTSEKKLIAKIGFEDGAKWLQSQTPAPDEKELLINFIRWYDDNYDELEPRSKENIIEMFLSITPQKEQEEKLVKVNTIGNSQTIFKQSAEDFLLDKGITIFVDLSNGTDLYPICDLIEEYCDKYSSDKINTSSLKRTGGNEMKKIRTLIYKCGVLTLVAGGGMYIVGWHFVWDNWIIWSTAIIAAIVVFSIQAVIYTRADKLKNVANKKFRV